MSGFLIRQKEQLAEGVFSLVVEAPLIAGKVLAGQFVILRINDQGERIPLTVADHDRTAGTIRLIFQVVGLSSQLLGQIKVGEYLLNLVGPLGHPSEIENFGQVVAIGGGVGVAVAFPVVKALKAAGNQVTAVSGFRHQELEFFSEEMKRQSDEFILMSDDGSVGRKGLVTDPLKEMIDKGLKIDRVIAIGPVPMMEAVCRVTKPAGIRTIVSLNPIMLDGTGMCGVCRVLVDGKNKFGCVDGPEFDGHLVDFVNLRQRLSTYRAEEKIALEKQGGCGG